MKADSLSQRLDDISAKIALASFVASDQNALGEQPRLGLYLLLHEQAEELRELAAVVPDVLLPTSGQERKES